MPGYQSANPDKAKIDEKYFCTYCKLLLREAMQTSCGHFYCQSCLANLIQDPISSMMVCVVDKEHFRPNEVYPDNFMRREVFALHVHCTFMEDGCKWKGEVRHLEEHTSKCEFQKVPCVHPDCGIMVKRADLAEHLENECVCRLVECRFCRAQITSNRMTLHHEKECQGYPVICEKCNKDCIPRSKLLEHQDPVIGDCVGVQGPCPFSQIGCSKTEVLNPRQKKEHMEQENTYHTTLALQYALRMSREMEALLTRDPRMMSRNPQIFTNYDGVISDLLARVQTSTAENRDLREKCREHSERIATLERKVASRDVSAAPPFSQGSADTNGGDLTRRLINVENRTADHEVLLVENNRSMEQANQDVGNVRRQLDTAQESMRRLERRIESVEHTLALRNVTLAYLEEYIRQQEFSSNGGHFLWKISDFSQKRNQSVNRQQLSFYSPCFYSSRYGYKMCARIYLNGDGMGRGTHMSVYFVVMRGPYDALLRWPFRLYVTFMLLDQDNVEHLTHTFRPDPSCSSFQRLSGFQNSKSGFPMFCALGELNRHAYVRDDTMFLRVIVHEEQLPNVLADDHVSSLEEQGRVQDTRLPAEVQGLQDRFNVLENRQTELLRSHDELKIESNLVRIERENAQLRLERRTVDLERRTSREVAYVRRQLQETARRTERRMESIEHTLALRNVTLADLEEHVRQQEFSSDDGQLLWRITEFSRKRNQAVNDQVSFYSPCFYTSRYGYKVCARIYLNGDGMGRGTHISVFVVIMRGPHDAVLRWPFRLNVTFMLLDQNNVEHVIDSFTPDPNSSSFQRPRGEMNIASGCPMFFSLAELNSHAYVRDDTMFVKIIVHTSDF